MSNEKSHEGLGSGYVKKKINDLSTFLKTKNATAFFPIYGQHLLYNLDQITYLPVGL